MARPATRKRKDPSAVSDAAQPHDAAPDVAPVADASEPAAGLGFEKWMGFLSGFVAPLTLVTALLFYFGYVSTREFFLYFGIDVDLIGLSSQEFVMRSPGALFIPVMILLLLSAGLIVGHRMLRRRLLARETAAAGRVVAVIAWTGIALVLAGLLVAFLGPVLADGGVAQLITPVLLAVGAGLCAYAASTARALGAAISRAVVVLLVLVMVAGTFWATATLAQWWGRGQARAVASDFTVLPAVVLDTRERLAPGNDAITFQELDGGGAAEGDAAGEPTYAFRYFGLRLLAQGDGRLYLVPDQWSPDASTIVVPYDDVRVRFRFVPDADPPTG